MRKLESVVVLVVLIVGGFATVVGAALAPGGSFFDDDLNVHEGAIEAIAAEGITKGCNPPQNTVYCPADSVTRGQMAAFLARALDLPAASTDYFTDDDGSVFESDINKVAKAGITKGCNPPANTNYCPTDLVTRGQMAAFLVRALGLEAGAGADLFSDDDNSVFEIDIDRLGTAAVTKGCNPPANDRYCPQSLVKRDQMASFLARALELPTTTPPVGFIGIFEGDDPDGSLVTITIGTTHSDFAVDVELYDDGGTICLNSFGEFSPASAQGTGTRLDATRIESVSKVTCHLSSGDRVVPGSFGSTTSYDPGADVITVDGVCHWRKGEGSAVDCA